MNLTAKDEKNYHDLPVLVVFVFPPPNPPPNVLFGCGWLFWPKAPPPPKALFPNPDIVGDLSGGLRRF